MNTTQEIERKTLDILKTGYIPQDNKNLITWGLLTALLIVSVAAAFQLGYSQASTAITTNFASLAEYRRLEQVIINDYFNKNSEMNTLPAPTKFNKNVPIYYLDSDGTPVLIN